MPRLNHRMVLDPTGTHCTVTGCGRLASPSNPAQHRRGWDARATVPPRPVPVALAVLPAPAPSQPRIDELVEELADAKRELSKLRGDVRTLIGAVDRLANVVGARQPTSTRRFADGRIREPRKAAA